MQPFTIAAFTFGTKNGTVPEIGTYKIIGFSVAVSYTHLGTVDENGQVEVLVTESIGPAKSKLRRCV